jgi:hypothetical protein
MIRTLYIATLNIVTGSIDFRSREIPDDIELTDYFSMISEEEIYVETFKSSYYAGNVLLTKISELRNKLQDSKANLVNKIIDECLT